MVNLIHVKLEYNEALEAKKQILSSEIQVLRIARIMKRYRSLRNEELKSKLKLKRKISEALAQIRKIQREFPEVNHESLKKIEKGHIPSLKTEKRERHNNNLEIELRDIQNKLNSLQGG